MATYNTGSSADDAIELVSSGAVSITDHGTNNGVKGSNHVGFRFPNVTITQGATITSAVLKFKLANYTGSGNVDHVTTYAEASDNAAQFTTGTSNISARARTTANIAANTLGATDVVWETNGFSVASLIQEVVNRGGWVSGNALAILFIGDGTAGNYVYPYQWDYSSGYYTAILTITTGPGVSASASISPPAIGSLQGSIAQLQTNIGGVIQQARGLGGINLPGNFQLQGTRAQGGPVESNKAYIIGESGPELFVPSMSGKIVPNNQIKARSSTTNIGNINVNNEIDGRYWLDKLTHDQEVTYSGLTPQRIR